MEISKDLFLQALGLSDPWYIKEIKLDTETNTFDVRLDFRKGAKFKDEGSGKEYGVFSTEEKKWKHLFMWQYVTYIHVRVPKIKTEDGKVRMINFPLARPGSGFTLLCEAFMLEMTKVMPIQKVGEMLKEHDGRIMRVIEYYVEKSMKEADFSEVKRVAIDETSRKKGHEYISILSNIDSGRVVSIADGKGKEAVENLVKNFEEHKGKREDVTEIGIDFSPAFIAGVQENFPNGAITHDRFHLMQICGRALDEVRRAETKGNAVLKKSKYLWLKNPKNLSEEKLQRLDLLKKENKVLSEAYQMKENLALFFEQNTIEEAEQYLKDWCEWVMSSSIHAMHSVAKTIKIHWNGILRYASSRITSGIAEGLNSVIQSLKRRARGYRNTKNFKIMIFLKLADFKILSKSVFLS